MFALTGLISNAGTIKACLNKFSLTYSNELSPKDRQLVQALQRRVSNIIQPLNYLYMVTTSSGGGDRNNFQVNSISMPAINECMGLLAEV